MQYDNKSVTRDGASLLAQSVNNAKPVIDKMLVLNTNVPLDKTIDSMELNDFSNALSFDVNNVSQNDNSFTASAVISNDGINQDYPAQLIGLTGYLDGANDKKLLAVAQASDPFVIEKQNGTPVKLVPSITFGFSNSQNVQLMVKNDVYVTAAELNDRFEHIDLSKYETVEDANKAHEELKTTIKNDIQPKLDKKVDETTLEELKNVSLTYLGVKNSDDDFNSLTTSGYGSIGNDVPKNLPSNIYIQWTNFEILSQNGVTTQILYTQNDGIIYRSFDTGDINYWNTGWKNINKKIDDLNLSNTNGKLMYGDKPVLVAQAPNAPKLSASINSDTGNLDYQITPPSVDGGASITGYQLSYKKKADTDWQIINIDKDSLNGNLNNLEKGTTYQLKAVAINYAGAGIGSDTVSILTAVAPKDVTIQVNNDYPKVSYSISVGNNGGASVNDYQLFYKKDSDTMWQLIDHANNNGEITKLEDNSTYQFKSKAGNVGGLSDDSNTANLHFSDNRIFGASWNQQSDPTLTRTDSAVGMVAGINGQRNDFDNASVWGKMHRVNDDKGNIFIRIPKFYIKKTQTQGLSTWQVSLIRPDDSWYLPKCFWNFSNSQELPYVDVGAYLANLNGSVLESKVNTVPANNTTIGSFRTYARNNGAGYQQLDIHVWDVLQTLFIIEFATLDSQSVMYGNATNYNSGYTDGMKGSSAGDSNNIKYRGIESMYCNIFQFIDGIGINAGSIYVCDDENNYSDSQFSYPYKPVSYRLPESGGYMQSAGLDLSNPEVTLPTSTTSTQGYYNDYCYNDSGSNYMMYAGGAGSNSGYGLFCAYVYYVFSTSSSYFGCRLIKKPVL